MYSKLNHRIVDFPMTSLTDNYKSPLIRNRIFSLRHILNLTINARRLFNSHKNDRFSKSPFRAIFQAIYCPFTRFKIYVLNNFFFRKYVPEFHLSHQLDFWKVQNW